MKIRNTLLKSVQRIALFLSLIFFLIYTTSCSLIKIKTDQEPLGIRELNTRILTQNFARDAMDRIEISADNIANASSSRYVQAATLYWKISSSEAFGKLSFQTEPKVALLDTWAYAIETVDAFESEDLDTIFGQFQHMAIKTAKQNVDEIEKIARSVLPSNEFTELKDFVEDYAYNHPIMQQEDFKHKSLREPYLAFKKIPDSIALQTVGTLSEVMSDATNRWGYYTDASSKQLKWQAELMLRRNGIDSLDVEAKLLEIENQFNRLVEVAENSPETIEFAIKEFRDKVGPIVRSLNYEMRSAMTSLSTDVHSIDSMLKRERVALDSIIKRERIALSDKADTLVETGISNAIESVGDAVRNLILYFILLFIVLMGLPFYVGFLIGRKNSKTKQ